MADMFGTVEGMRASQEDRRAERAADLDAQKAMGALAMQPDQQRMYQAQTAQAQATAERLGAETRALNAQFQDQEKLEQISRLVAAKRARGEIATVADLQDGRPRSVADDYTEWLRVAMDEGVSPILTDKVADTIAQIRQKEAAAGASQAAQQLSQSKEAKERINMIGSFASAALKAGPTQWANMRQMAVDRAPPGQTLMLDRLPQDWNMAQPMLQAALNASIDAVKQLEMQDKKIHDAAQRKNWASDSAKDVADIEQAKKYGLFIDAKRVALERNGGGNSPEAMRAREELAKSRKAIRDANERKEFKAMPLSADDLDISQGYKDAYGRYVYYIGEGKDGKPAFRQVFPNFPDGSGGKGKSTAGTFGEGKD